MYQPGVARSRGVAATPTLSHDRRGTHDGVSRCRVGLRKSPPPRPSPVEGRAFHVLLRACLRQGRTAVPHRDGSELPAELTRVLAPP